MSDEAADLGDQPGAPVRVLVADDDQFNRRGMRDILTTTSDLVVVGEISDGDEAVAAVGRLRPHVVLMDLRMNRVGGLEATRLVRALPDPPQVVAVTAMAVDDLVEQALAAGAITFLRKDERPTTFVHAVRAAAQGLALFNPDAVRTLARSVPAAAAAPPGPGRAAVARLTDREREVLVRVAQGCSNAVVASQLFLGETTVKTHLSSVFTKLGVSSRVEAALAAYRAGLVTT